MRNGTQRVIFLSPHPDDECLFGAYIIQNEKPLVIILENTEERMQESREAMEILGVEVIFTKETEYQEADRVYAPALEHGHPLHDKVSLRAKELWGDKVRYYSTYRSGEDLQPKGDYRIPHTEEMKRKKIEALKCYKSQIIATPCHFNLENKDEYLCDYPDLHHQPARSRIDQTMHPII